MDLNKALDVLNYYRNLHYKAADGTNEKELADSINVVLPRFCSLMQGEKALATEASKTEETALWEICEVPNTFDTYGKPDKYARCSCCGFQWKDLYAVRTYFEKCPRCGKTMTGCKEAGQISPSEGN